MTTVGSVDPYEKLVAGVAASAQRQLQIDQTDDSVFATEQAQKSSSGDSMQSSGDSAYGKLLEGSAAMSKSTSSSDIAALEAQFEETQKSKGIFGKMIDGVCNFFGTKNSPKKVKESIEKAKNGEITAQEASEHIATHAQKSKSVLNTVANVVSGVAVVVGVVLAAPTGGLSLGAAAAIGAGAKLAIKAGDAATNDVKGDYGVKEVFKDGVTGAVGGVVTAATAGMGAGAGVAKEGGKVLVKQTVINGVKAGAKAGAIDGAVMGATNYTVDAIAEEDVKFSFGGLVTSTATGAATGAVAGGVAGGVTSGFGALTASKAAREGTGEIIEDATKGATKEVTEEATETVAVSTTKEVAEETTETVTETTTKGWKDTSFGDMVKNTKDKVASKADGITGGRASKYATNVKNKTTDMYGSIKQKGSDLTTGIKNKADDWTGGKSSEFLSSVKNKAKTITNNKYTTSIKTHTSDAWASLKSLKNMTPADAKIALTGKANATASELKLAYQAMCESREFANPAMRALLEDAYNVGNLQEI